ncbi:hypothetical protein ACSBR2_043043 [Camellia fascicularis]
MMMSEKRRVRERRLYEVSLSGNVQALEVLFEEGTLILDKLSLTSSFDHDHDHDHDHDNHKTPLYIVALRGHLDIVRQLLEATNNAEDDFSKAQNENGITPLHLAAMSGRVEVVKLMIQTCPESIYEKLERRE